MIFCKKDRAFDRDGHGERATWVTVQVLDRSSYSVMSKQRSGLRISARPNTDE